MLDNFLNIVSTVKNIHCNLYVCVIYRRASHEGSLANHCFIRFSSFLEVEPKFQRRTKKEQIQVYFFRIFPL